MPGGFTRAKRAQHAATQRDLLEAAWAERDRAELLEARALIADLMKQLDLANAAAVRMAQGRVEVIHPKHHGFRATVLIDGEDVRDLI